MQLALMVAAAENDVIGRNNALPWHLPQDLAYFKRVTMGKPIIMGRKTFESIGRPLPGRTNIVISRNAAFEAEGARCVGSLQQGLALAENIALIDGVDEAVVIGGAEIYAASLPLAQRLYLTRVHAEVDGDVRLPAIDWAHWRECERTRHEAEPPNPYAYSFLVYERVD
ncbi:MAG: dihydrofolate reductase [Halioglobus sp.]